MTSQRVDEVVARHGCADRMTTQLDDILRQSALLCQVSDQIDLRFIVATQRPSEFRLAAFGAKRPFVRKQPPPTLLNVAETAYSNSICVCTDRTTRSKAALASRSSVVHSIVQFDRASNFLNVAIS